MREPETIQWETTPPTREHVLEQGLWEFVLMASGDHLQDPCYAEKRRISDLAKRWMEFADHVEAR